MDEVYKTELYQGMKALGYGVDRIRELDDDGQETGASTRGSRASTRR
jgi:hypothetical protein